VSSVTVALGLVANFSHTATGRVKPKSEAARALTACSVVYLPR